jgi:hypothetical protein
VLKGAKPADLPIEQQTRIVMVINARTAKMLGRTTPQTPLMTVFLDLAADQMRDAMGALGIELRGRNGD